MAEVGVPATRGFRAKERYHLWLSGQTSFTVTQLRSLGPIQQCSLSGMPATEGIYGGQFALNFQDITGTRSVFTRVASRYPRLSEFSQTPTLGHRANGPKGVWQH